MSDEPRTASSMTPAVLLSFDVEEFDAPLERGHMLSMDEQMRIGGAGYSRLLDLLDELNVTATHFVTASFATRFPELVRRAASRHEIASHGFNHATFEDGDLARSRDALEEISQKPVRGFRRARLQATDAAAILAAGYRWDSSENPIWLPGRYNNLGKPRTLYHKGSLAELPISASPSLRFPLFWLAMKNSPMALIRAASRACLRRDGYLNVFWHPWEFIDLSQSRLPRYMRRPDGERMCERLRGYVRWLARSARFEAITPWLERTGALA